jgi:hypothetical protein
MANTIIIAVFILTVVTFITVSFAGIHVWAQSLMILSIFGITAAVLWAWPMNISHYHVHMCIAIPPKHPVAWVIGFLKGRAPSLWLESYAAGSAI